MLETIITALALPVVTALINLGVAMIGKRDSKLGQAASKIGTDLIELFAVLFPKRCDK